MSQFQCYCGKICKNRGALAKHFENTQKESSTMLRFLKKKPKKEPRKIELVSIISKKRTNPKQRKMNSDGTIAPQRVSPQPRKPKKRTSEKGKFKQRKKLLQNLFLQYQSFQSILIGDLLNTESRM